jgi:quinol-cytochrome oxidoreductase complex cytochrome b subunit
MSDDTLDPPVPDPEQQHLDDDLIDGRRPMPFFPDFALIEAITALVFLVVLVIIASVTEPSLESSADPTASGYVPRPEWYFLWVFELLKYFKGESEVIGTFVLPVIVIGLLVGLPFLDRRERTRALLPGTRQVRLWPRIAAGLAIVAIGSLTLTAMASESPMTSEGTDLTPTQAAGMALYERLGCSSCHTIADAGGDRGPELTTFGTNTDASERVLLHFTGIREAPGSVMPGYQLSDSELSSLGEYLMSLKGGG